MRYQELRFNSPAETLAEIASGDPERATEAILAAALECEDLEWATAVAVTATLARSGWVRRAGVLGLDHIVRRGGTIDDATLREVVARLEADPDMNGAVDDLVGDLVTFRGTTVEDYRPTASRRQVPEGEHQLTDAQTRELGTIVNLLVDGAFQALVSVTQQSISIEALRRAMAEIGEPLIAIPMDVLEMSFAVERVHDGVVYTYIDCDLWTISRHPCDHTLRINLIPTESGYYDARIEGIHVL